MCSYVLLVRIRHIEVLSLPEFLCPSACKTKFFENIGNLSEYYLTYKNFTSLEGRRPSQIYLRPIGRQV